MTEQGKPAFDGLLGAWGLVPRVVEPVRAAYRVVTDRGVVALKATRDNPERLRVMDEACAYLAGRGFRRTPPLLPTLAGELHVERGRERWTVYPWIAGREADYQVPGDSARCAATLAAFHQAGLGFRAARGRVRSLIGKWPAKLRSRSAEFRAYLAQARRAARPTEFEAVMVEVGDDLAVQAELASDLLARSAYASRSEWAAQALPLCHGDPSDRNFLLGEDGLVHVIDLAALKHDLPELDLARFLRRTMRRAGWDFPLAVEMLEAYDRCRPLERSARDIMAAVLRFPDKAWRLLKQHYRDDGLDAGEKAPRLARKLREVARQLPRKASFLEKLREL